MTEFTQTILAANIYRYLLIIVGFVVVHMGYRLFVLGYFEKAGELKASFGTNHILLKQVGPGIFFALFGVAIICVGVFRRIEISVPNHWGKMAYTKPCDTPGEETEKYQGSGPAFPKKNGSQPLPK